MERTRNPMARSAKTSSGDIGERDIHVQIRALLLLELLGHLPAAERVLRDLLLNLFGRVGEKDRAVVVARRHLPLSTFQRREKLRVDERRLALQRMRGRDNLMRDASGNAEVRILRRTVFLFYRCFGVG